MSQRPISEVFGFKVDDFSAEAQRHRHDKLCPFSNKGPNCTKNSILKPLGVCSIYEDLLPVITCPVRFREDWIIASEAAAFFFPVGATWTSLTEVRLNDAEGGSAGNIDVVLISYNADGQIIDFGSLEIQAVYISGNVTKPFDYYMKDPTARREFVWSDKSMPRPDYLSSSRKRLAPQMLFKGGIFHAWKKKQAVALTETFFNTLPKLPEVDPANAELAWFLYELKEDTRSGRFKLTHIRTVYTGFDPALVAITRARPGDISRFVGILQKKFDEMQSATPPDIVALQDLITLDDLPDQPL
jgi:hypothetical protein